MITKEALAIKQKIKSKIPKFLRENIGALPRLNRKVWRKPKGIHSKARHGFAGHRNRVEPGYGTPAALRGVGKQGLKEVLVHNLAELEKLNPSTEGAVLASVGLLNKINLIKKSQEKKITILNLKNPTKFLTDVEQEIKQRKEAKKTLQKTKEEKAKKIETEAKKTQKEPEASKTESSEDTKKQETKKELDKILTKKE